MDPQDKAKLVARNAQVIGALASSGSSGKAFSVLTRFGEVKFQSIATKLDADGVEFLDIRLAGDTASGDPHFRIYYPPLAVPDPQGPIEHAGKRYRQDPLLAVAEVVARFGGHAKTGRYR